ncbi:YbaK/EbsC family protein [Aquipuribacter sp. MA13-6]|uniref:YbaK/EbsC family protein n=1 Tax=unclassified Aquipuribacter TaxID=2635084 RepID=UPI003EEDC54E
MLGSLATTPAADRPDLLASTVAAALWSLPREEVLVAEIDAYLADTAAFCEAYGVTLEQSANCVVVAGRRGDVTTLAACVVLATTRCDVNGVVRKRLDARKASFAPMDVATEATGMAYGGITPVGLPADWPMLLVDDAVVQQAWVVIGSGVRHSKLLLPGALLAQLPGAEVVEGLAR